MCRCPIAQCFSMVDVLMSGSSVSVRGMPVAVFQSVACPVAQCFSMVVMC